MTENLLLEGVVLMLMGMGVVISFLFIMIIGMRLMSKVIAYLNKLFPEVLEETASAAKKASANIDEAIAVALAAIAAERN